MKLDFSRATSTWQKMPPSSQKKVMFVAIGVIACLVYFMMPSSAPTKQTQKLKEAPSRSVFSPTDTRAVGMDGLATQQKEILKLVKGVQAQNEKLNEELTELKARRGETSSVQLEVQTMKDENRRLRESLKSQGYRIEDLEVGGIPVQETRNANDPRSTVKAPEEQVNSEQFENDSLFRRSAPDPEKNQSVDPREKEGESSDAPKGNKSKKLVVTENKKTESEDEVKSLAPIIVPAGSIMSGVLMSGIDAPAGPKASSAPIPSTARVQGEALLPNNRTVDLSDCFITMSTYGDLPSERVYGRTEEINCFSENGTLYSGEIKGYLTGEDSKVGVRGTVVQKTGSLIANTLLAGFGSGISKTMDRQLVPSINTTGNQQYTGFDRNTLQSGLSMGVSDTLGDVAKYYLNLAEQIFPVIEISGGRNIEIILTGTLKLKPVKETKKSKDTTNENN